MQTSLLPRFSWHTLRPASFHSHFTSYNIFFSIFNLVRFIWESSVAKWEELSEQSGRTSGRAICVTVSAEQSWVTIGKNLIDPRFLTQKLNPNIQSTQTFFAAKFLNLFLITEPLLTQILNVNFNPKIFNPNLIRPNFKCWFPRKKLMRLIFKLFLLTEKFFAQIIFNTKYFLT